MKINWPALAAMLAVGGSAVLLQSEPAQGQGALDSLRSRQKQKAPPPPPPAQPAQPDQAAPTGQPGVPVREYNLSRAERTALTPAIQAAERSDWPAVEAALPAAIAAAQGADAKYVVAQIRLRIGIGTNNVPAQTQAIDELIASGGAQASELPGLYETQAQLATAAGDHAKAERAMNELARLSPNDPEAIVRIARYRAGRNDNAGAIQQWQRAFQLRQAAGQPISEDWRKQVLALAYRARMPQAVGYARELVQAYPSPTNWRDAWLIYRELGNVPAGITLDLRRFMRAAQALTSERDYNELAEGANRAGLPGEVKAVLDEGISRGTIQATSPWVRDLSRLAGGRIPEDRASLPGLRAQALAAGNGEPARQLGDVYYGYGQYADAAALYRAALQKSGEDANLLNTRLGAALALAGQRAEAEAAFRAVTGPRAELAQFWLLWLSTRG